MKKIFLIACIVISFCVSGQKDSLLIWRPFSVIVMDSSGLASRDTAGKWIIKTNKIEGLLEVMYQHYKRCSDESELANKILDYIPIDGSGVQPSLLRRFNRVVKKYIDFRNRNENHKQ